MKSNLTKLSLALLSAVFILGCQDLGTGAVASDGLEPQFARGGKGKPPSGNESAKVTLAGGMTTAVGDTLMLSGKNDVQTVTLGTNSDPGNQPGLRNVDIVVSFDYLDDPDDGPDMKCTVTAGEGGKIDGVLLPDEKTYLLEQLVGVALADGGGFHLQIDKTDLPHEDTFSQAEQHSIGFGYDAEFDDHPVHVGIKHQGGGRLPVTTVTWEASTPLQDVFTFTGPIRVSMGGVGGLTGRRGGRAIACGTGTDNLVTVTVSKPGA